MKSFGKTDVRYWTERVFRRKRDGSEDTQWTVQIQYLDRREQFPLGTPNKAAAAAKARDIYVSLHGRGWEETLALYKPKAEESKPEKSTVGDLIREVAANANYRVTTFAVYCGALRRISADIAKIKGGSARFAHNGTGNKEWRESVDATPFPGVPTWSSLRSTGMRPTVPRVSVTKRRRSLMRPDNVMRMQ